MGSVLVKVWNNTSFPAYKSRLWDNGVAKDKESVKRYVHTAICFAIFD